MNRLALLFLLFLFWVMLTWTTDPPEAAYLQDLAVGLAAAVLVTRTVGVPQAEPIRWLDPQRYVWAMAYLFVLAASIVKANLEVAYRVLHPAMPIRPGIVRVRTQLRSPAARTLLGNSVTLCPGTLTLDIWEDGTMMVHCIYVRSTEEGESRDQILGRFEWFLQKIFE